MAHSNGISVEDFLEQQKKQLGELYTQISLQNTKIKLLEKELMEERQDREEMPIPRTFIKRTQKLMNENQKLKDDVNYYKRFVSQNIIDEREKRNKPTRGSLGSVLKKTK